MTTLHTEPCGCKVVRNTEGDKCGVHIEWCALHGAAKEMRDTLADIASGPCCGTPGCSYAYPRCDTMAACAALAKAEGEQ